MRYAMLGFLFLVLMPGTSRAQFNPFANTPFDPSTYTDLDPNASGSAANQFVHPQQSVTTIDDPNPPQAGPSYVNFTYYVTNYTSYNVAFQLTGTTGGQWYTIAPQHWRKLPGSIPANQTPVVIISQIGGGVRRFTIQSGIAYAFRVNPSTNQIENYYRD